MTSLSAQPLPGPARGGRIRSRTPAITLVLVLAFGGLFAASGCGPALAKPGGARVGASVSPVTGAPHPRCTLYVAAKGSAAATGRVKLGPTTLLAALRRVVPGSVVCLEADTYYTRSNVTLTRSGRRSAPITFTGDGGTVLIKYVGGKSDGGVLQTTFCRPWCASHDLVIENLTIDGGNMMDAGVFVREGAHDVTVRDCVIRSGGASGIALNAVDYVRAEHNLIYHTGYNQGFSSGIALWYGGSSPTYGGRTAFYDRAAGFHNYVVSNIVSGAFDNSGHHTDGNGIIVDGSGLTPPTLIENNLVYENSAAGIGTYRNRGSIWLVNNTAYASGLNLAVGNGYASDYSAIYSTNIHWIDNLAYGRLNRARYHTAWIYNNTASKISWTHNMGYNGTTTGVAHKIRSDSRYYRYADPVFTSLPPIPSGASPWARATPPWALGNDFALRPGSPALNWGVDPATVAGLTPALRAGLPSEVIR
jgi:hypothetical protein